MEVKSQLPKNDYIYFTPSGNKEAPVYQRQFNEKLKRNVVIKTKDFDIYEFIQSSATKTDLAMLRQQMIATGQLPSVTDEVIDYSLMPTNIHELNDVVNSVDERFNALPDSIKQVFGTKDKFLASLVAGTYEKDIITYYERVAGASNKATDEVKKEEVKEDESK